MTVPSADILAPLFRASFVSRQAAADVLKRPDVRQFMGRTVGRLYGSFPGLGEIYPSLGDLRDHIVGCFVERVFGDGKRPPGLDAMPDDPARYIARILRNLVQDELRKIKRTKQLGKKLVEQSSTADTDENDPHTAPNHRDASDSANHAIAIFRSCFANNPRRYAVCVAHFYPRSLTVDDLTRAADSGAALFVRPADETLALLEKLGTGAGIEVTEMRRDLAWIFACSDPTVTSWADWELLSPDVARTALDTLRVAFNRAIADVRKVIKPGEWP
jgi:hypothetical protein